MDEFGFISGPASDDEWGQFNDTIAFAENITVQAQAQLEEAIANGDWSAALTQAAVDLGVDDDSSSNSLYTTIDSAIEIDIPEIIVTVYRWYWPSPIPTPAPTMTFRPTDTPTPVPSEDPLYEDIQSGPILTTASFGLILFQVVICAGLAAKAAHSHHKKHNVKQEKFDRAKKKIGEDNLIDLFGVKPLQVEDMVKDDLRRARVHKANLEGFTQRMIEAMFEGLDTDGDGYIDRVDIENFCKESGSPLEEKEIEALLLAHGVPRTPEMWLARKERAIFLEEERIRLKKEEDIAIMEEAKAQLQRIKKGKAAKGGKGNGKGGKGSPRAKPVPKMRGRSPNAPLVHSPRAATMSPDGKLKKRTLGKGKGKGGKGKARSLSPVRTKDATSPTATRGRSPGRGPVGRAVSKSPARGKSAGRSAGPAVRSQSKGRSKSHTDEDAPPPPPPPPVVLTKEEQVKAIEDTLIRLKINPVMFYNLANKEKKKAITKKEVKTGLQQMTKLDLSNETMVDVMKCIDPTNTGNITLKSVKDNFKRLTSITKINEKPKVKPPPPKKVKPPTETEAQEDAPVAPSVAMSSAVMAASTLPPPLNDVAEQSINDITSSTTMEDEAVTNDNGEDLDASTGPGKLPRKSSIQMAIDDLKQKDEDEKQAEKMLKEAEEEAIRRREAELKAERRANKLAFKAMKLQAKQMLVLTPDAVEKMLLRYPQLAFHWDDALESTCNPVMGTVQHFSRKMNSFLFKHLDTDEDGFIEAKDLLCWSKMLRIGRPMNEFVDAIMAADHKGIGKVTESELFFLLRENLLLAAELDAQCRVLQFILEPPEDPFPVDYSKLSAEKMGATSEESEDYGQNMVNKMSQSMVNYMTGQTLINDPFSDPFEPLVEAEHAKQESLLPLTRSMDDVTGAMLTNKTPSLRISTDTNADAMFGADGESPAFVNDMAMVDPSQMRDPNNPFLYQGQVQTDLVKRKQQEEADVLVFRALAKMLLNRSLAAHKQLMAFQYNIAVDIFNVLDTNRLGIIDFFDIQLFLRTHCHVSVSEDDLTFLRINKAPHVRNLLVEEQKIVSATGVFNANKVFKAKSVHETLVGDVDVEDSDEEVDHHEEDKIEEAKLEAALKAKEKSTQLDPEELQALLDAPAHSNLQRLLHQAALHKREKDLEAEEAEEALHANEDSGGEEDTTSMNKGGKDAGALLKAAKANAKILQRRASSNHDSHTPMDSQGQFFEQQLMGATTNSSDADHEPATRNKARIGGMRRKSLNLQRKTAHVSKMAKFYDPPPEGHQPWSQRDVQMFFHMLDTDADGCISAKDLGLWLRMMLGPDESTINRRDVQGLFHPNAPQFAPPIRKKKTNRRQSINNGHQRKGSDTYGEQGGVGAASFAGRPAMLNRHASANNESFRQFAAMQQHGSFQKGKSSSFKSSFKEKSVDDTPRMGPSSRPSNMSRVMSATNLFGGGANEDKHDSDSEYEDVPDNDGYASTLRLDGMNEDGLITERGLGMVLKRRPYLASQILLLYKSYQTRMDAEDGIEHFEPQVAAVLETLKDLLDEALERQQTQSTTKEQVLVDRYGYLTDRELNALVIRRRQQYNMAYLAAKRHLEVLSHLETGIKMHFLADREMDLYPKKVAAARALGAYRAPVIIARAKEAKRLSVLAEKAAKMKASMPANLPGMGWDASRALSASAFDDSVDDTKGERGIEMKSNSISDVQLGPMKTGRKKSSIWDSTKSIDEETEEERKTRKEMAKEAMEDASNLDALDDLLEKAGENKDDDDEEEDEVPKMSATSSPRAKKSLNKAWSLSDRMSSGGDGGEMSSSDRRRSSNNASLKETDSFREKKHHIEEVYDGELEGLSSTMANILKMRNKPQPKRKDSYDSGSGSGSDSDSGSSDSDESDEGARKGGRVESVGGEDLLMALASNRRDSSSKSIKQKPSLNREESAAGEDSLLAMAEAAPEKPVQRRPPPSTRSGPSARTGNSSPRPRSPAPHARSTSPGPRGASPAPRRGRQSTTSPGGKGASGSSLSPPPSLVKSSSKSSIKESNAPSQSSFTKKSSTKGPSLRETPSGGGPSLREPASPSGLKKSGSMKGGSFKDRSPSPRLEAKVSKDEPLMTANLSLEEPSVEVTPTAENVPLPASAMPTIKTTDKEEESTVAEPLPFVPPSVTPVQGKGGGRGRGKGQSSVAPLPVTHDDTVSSSSVSDTDALTSGKGAGRGGRGGKGKGSTTDSIAPPSSSKGKGKGRGSSPVSTGKGRGKGRPAPAPAATEENDE